MLNSIKLSKRIITNSIKRSVRTNALIAIADGTEDIECVTVIDLLRRASINTTVASIMKNQTITTAHGLAIV